MALANRTMRIDQRKWNHWVKIWTHEIKMEHPRGSAEYMVQWQSGDDDNARLTVDGVEVKSGNWVQLALEANAMDGAPAADDEIKVGCGRYFVMFPFFPNEMSDADHRQLQNLPPRAPLLRRMGNAVRNVARRGGDPDERGPHSGSGFSDAYLDPVGRRGAGK